VQNNDARPSLKKCVVTFKAVPARATFDCLHVLVASFCSTPEKKKHFCSQEPFVIKMAARQYARDSPVSSPERYKRSFEERVGALVRKCVDRSEHAEYLDAKADFVLGLTDSPVSFSHREYLDQKADFVLGLGDSSDSVSLAFFAGIITLDRMALQVFAGNALSFTGFAYVVVQ